VDNEPRRFSIEELADLAGVSRRTVRYYVQEGLLPTPLGVGRGRHYDRSHLDRLLEVKAGQEAGRSLDEIRTARPRGGGGPRPAASAAPRIARTAWLRLEVAPGVELHVASDIKLPAGARLDELAEWCRRHLSRNSEHEE
jgi:DNA-binding transcriptional MerR regulator